MSPVCSVQSNIAQHSTAQHSQSRRRRQLTSVQLCTSTHMSAHDKAILTDGDGKSGGTFRTFRLVVIGPARVGKTARKFLFLPWLGFLFRGRVAAGTMGCPDGCLLTGFCNDALQWSGGFAMEVLTRSRWTRRVWFIRRWEEVLSSLSFLGSPGLCEVLLCLPAVGWVVVDAIDGRGTVL